MPNQPQTQQPGHYFTCHMCKGTYRFTNTEQEMKKEYEAMRPMYEQFVHKSELHDTLATNCVVHRSADGDLRLM